jgi:hypothetical protein
MVESFVKLEAALGLNVKFAIHVFPEEKKQLKLLKLKQSN